MMPKPVHKITILNPIEAECSAAFATLVKDAVSFPAVYWKQGIYRKERTEYTKSMMTKGKGGVYHFWAGLVDRIAYFCEENNIDYTIVDNSLEDITTYEPALPGITFRPDQLSLINTFLDRPRGTIVSFTGSGKTVLGFGILSAYPGLKVLWLCHKIDLVEQTYKSALAFGFTSVGRYGGGRAEGGKDITISTRQSFKKLTDEQGHLYDIVVTDECFAAGTPISAPFGNREIQDIKTGDVVCSLTGHNRVARTFKNAIPLNRLAKITMSDGSIYVCSDTHLFDVRYAWMEAKYLSGKELTRISFSDMMHCITLPKGDSNERKNLPPMRKSVSNTLQHLLLQTMWLQRSRKKQGQFRENDQNQSKKKEHHFRKNEGKQPFSHAGCPRKNKSNQKNKWYSRLSKQNRSRRKRESPVCCGDVTYGSFRKCLEEQPHSDSFSRQAHRVQENCRIPNTLQGRHSASKANDCYRGGRSESQLSWEKRTGCQERNQIDSVRVVGVEVYQRGSNDRSFEGIISDQEKDQGFKYLYDFEVENDHNYYVDGLLVHNCHHVAKKDSQYQYVLTRVPAPIRLGLTATLMDDDSEEVLVCEGLIGPVLGELTINEGSDLGILAEPRIKLHKLNKDFDVADLRKYADVYNAGVTHNLALNLMIAQIAKAHAEKNETVLIIVDKIDHGHNIVEQLDALNVECKYVWGATKSQERVDVKEALNSGELKVVVASIVWVEGVDIPNLNAVINAAGGKSEKNLLQKVGRGLRKTSEKDEVYIHDFFNNSHRFLIEHFGERLVIYMDNSWL